MLRYVSLINFNEYNFRGKKRYSLTSDWFAFNIQNSISIKSHEFKKDVLIQKFREFDSKGGFAKTYNGFFLREFATKHGVIQNVKYELKIAKKFISKLQRVYAFGADSHQLKILRTHLLKEDGLRRVIMINFVPKIIGDTIQFNLIGFELGLHGHDGKFQSLYAYNMPKKKVDLPITNISETITATMPTIVCPSTTPVISIDNEGQVTSYTNESKIMTETSNMLTKIESDMTCGNQMPRTEIQKAYDRICVELNADRPVYYANIRQKVQCIGKGKSMYGIEYLTVWIDNKEQLETVYDPKGKFFSVEPMTFD